MGIAEWDFSQLKKAKDWRREDAAHIFATDGSWDWFERMHRQELVKSGALILRIGRSGNLANPSIMNVIVPELLHKDSLAKIEQQAA